MEEEYEFALVKWAHKYDGYKRLAHAPENLWDLVRPLSEAFERSGEIPEWGVSVRIVSPAARLIRNGNGESRLLASSRAGDMHRTCGERTGCTTYITDAR